MKKIGTKIWVLGLLFVSLPLMAWDFQSQPFEGNSQLKQEFRSTSTMTPSGSLYASMPSLNADGTAAYSAPIQAAYSEAGRPGSIKTSTGTPGSGGTQLPIGDGMWAMIVMAIGYALFIARRKAKVKSEK